MTGDTLHRRTPEETVVLNTLLPEVLALVSSVKEELDLILVIGALLHQGK
jgi:hypothetical protein